MTDFLSGLDWWEYFIFVPMGLACAACVVGLVGAFAIALWEAVFIPIEEDKWLYRAKGLVALFMASLTVGFVGMVVSI